jgi:hypothetical protein
MDKNKEFSCASFKSVDLTKMMITSVQTTDEALIGQIILLGQMAQSDIEV